MVSELEGNQPKVATNYPILCRIDQNNERTITFPVHGQDNKGTIHVVEITNLLL